MNSSSSSDSEAEAVASTSTNSSLSEKPPDRYQPPSNYDKCVYTKKPGIWLEDIQNHEELWLMSTPLNFDCKELVQKQVLFGASISIKNERDENDDDIKYCWEINAQKGQKDNSMVVLLPSKKDKCLHVAKGITGQMCITKNLQLTPYNMVDPPIKRGAKIPEGLVMRNVPFGADLAGEHKTSKEKHKKKKSKMKRERDDVSRKQVHEETLEISGPVQHKKKKHKKHKSHE